MLLILAVALLLWAAYVGIMSLSTHALVAVIAVVAVYFVIKGMN
jgi:hypothetical protein